METMPYVTLTNGITVGNFSSPHSFEFEDGTILPACSEERARKLQIIFNEEETGGFTKDLILFKNIKLSFDMSEEVASEMDVLEKKYPNIDIIICPLPMIQALRAIGFNDNDILLSKYRSIRVTNRIAKKISINKFCI